MSEKVKVEYEGFAIGTTVFFIDWCENKVIEGEIDGVEMRLNNHVDARGKLHTTAETYHVAFSSDQLESDEGEEITEDTIGRCVYPDELWKTKKEALTVLTTGLTKNIVDQAIEVSRMSMALQNAERELKEQTNA